MKKIKSKGLKLLKTSSRAKRVKGSNSVSVKMKTSPGWTVSSGVILFTEEPEGSQDQRWCVEKMTHSVTCGG